MKTSGGSSDSYRNSASGGNSRRYGMSFSAANFIQAPLSALLEYSGILQGRSNHQENEGLIGGGVTGFKDGPGGGEVSIWIIGAREQEHAQIGTGVGALVGQGRIGAEGDSDENGGGSGEGNGVQVAATTTVPNRLDQRFSPEEHYEWLKDYSHFRDLIQQQVKPTDSVGCCFGSLNDMLA